MYVVLNNSNSKLYRVNNSYKNKEEFMELIGDTLEKYPFCSISQLSLILKAYKRDVEEVLYDFIIREARSRQITTMRDLCACLKVRTKYVNDLLDDDRLVLVDRNVPQELIQLEESSLELNSRVIEKNQKQESIRGLAKVLNDTRESEPRQSTGARYHTSFNNHDENRFRTRRP